MFIICHTSFDFNLLTAINTFTLFHHKVLLFENHLNNKGSVTSMVIYRSYV